jgi:hypothetical protein
MSPERQLIQGNPSAGNISTIRFEKKGDLINYVYMTAKDSTGAVIPLVGWSNVIDKVELLIGGQIVDTQDITWMTKIEPITGDRIDRVAAGWLALARADSSGFDMDVLPRFFGQMTKKNLRHRASTDIPCANK